MDVEIGPALVAGFVGTVVLTVVLRAWSVLGPVRMPGMALIQGAMVTDDPRLARYLGAFTHVVVMGTVVFGLGYAALFSLVGTAAWLLGLFLGVVHGIVAGGVMGPLGRVHPRMEPAAAFAGDAPWRVDERGLALAAPGTFALDYGPGAPLALIMGHALYGVALSVVYATAVR